MVASELLDILVCPETKQSLSLLEEEQVLRVNTRIEAGEALNREGKKVEQRVEGLLLREDRAYAYPIRDSIPVMLVEEAIAMVE